jgi:hypothetical protein
MDDVPFWNPIHSAFLYETIPYRPKYGRWQMAVILKLDITKKG